MPVAWSRIHPLRLRNHFLTRPAGTGKMLEVPSAVCGIQAQVPQAAERKLGRFLGAGAEVTYSD